MYLIMLRTYTTKYSKEYFISKISYKKEMDSILSLMWILIIPISPLPSHYNLKNDYLVPIVIDTLTLYYHLDC